MTRPTASSMKVRSASTRRCDLRQGMQPRPKLSRGGHDGERPDSTLCRRLQQELPRRRLDLAEGRPQVPSMHSGFPAQV